MKKILNRFIVCFFLIPFIGLDNISYSESSQKRQVDELIISSSKEIGQKKLITVVVNGKGRTIDDAMQDAAVNALTQVAGSFMDSETLLRNKSEIKEGVLSKSKVINKNMRDYSQGSIKSFEVIQIKKDGSFYDVKAKVDVRREEFETYVKKVASGSKKLKKGLFAQLATENQESESKVGFFKKVVSPINEAEVIEIEVGNLITLKSFISPQKKDTETIEATGFGKTIDDAVQDSAVNALSKVVGSFMDTETYLKNRIKITDGIIDQSKMINKNVKEYSKGSITYFEILNTSNDQGVFMVRAKVTVGLDDFRSYFDDLLAFGSNVSSYSDSSCMQIFGYENVCNKDFNFFTSKGLFPNNTFLIPFKIKLRDGYLANSENILRKVSSENLKINPSPFSSYNFNDLDDYRDHIISIIDLNSNKASVRKYVLKGVKEQMQRDKGGKNKNKSQDEILLYSNSCDPLYKDSTNTKIFEIQFLDDKNNIVKKINPTCANSSLKGVYTFLEVPTKGLYNLKVYDNPWMSLYTRSDECKSKTNSEDFALCETQVISERSFWVAFQIDFEEFEDVTGIEIIYVDAKQ